MKQTTQQRLREALSARNMLPIELSRLSGIGKSAISQYLSGKVTPKQDKIYKLAQALKVNESWLMGYDEPMEQSPAAGDLPTLTQRDSTAHSKRDLNDLAKFLNKTEVMFDGDTYNLSEEDQQKLRSALEFVFWDAKRKNKRKKD
jgi:immunity repressor protein|nr:helix-turn-helix domain-containing protein [uncultured Selenomonas sp.]